MQSSKQSSIFIGARAQGSEYGGHRYGGIYYPAHNKNGRFIPARFEANFMLNSPDFTDAQGNPREGRHDTFRIVAWNHKSAAPGKGIADTLAKCVSVGKEMHFINVILQSYPKTVRVDGEIIVTKAGKAATQTATAFRVSNYDQIAFGNDSLQTLQNEVNNWNQGVQNTFTSRPADPTAWEAERARRKAVTFQPGDTSYGYARVIVPEGAVVGQPNMDPNLQGASPTQAAGFVHPNNMGGAGQPGGQMSNQQGGYVPPQAGAEAGTGGV